MSLQDYLKKQNLIKSGKIKIALQKKKTIESILDAFDS